MGHIEEGDLQSLVDGALDPERSVKIREHLAGCGACSKLMLQVEMHTQYSGDRLSVLSAVGSERPRELPAARARFKAFKQQKEHKSMWFQSFLGRSRAFQVTALLIAILVISLAFPPVRAIANSFLGLFRVQQIAVVEVNPANLPEQLGSSATFEQLLAENLVYQEPASPQQVGSAEEAARSAAMTVRLPASAETPVQYWVQSGSHVEFLIDVERLEFLMREMGLDDMKLPARIDGQKASLSIPASVVAGYGECEMPEAPDASQEDRPARQDRCTMLVQIPSPSVEAPPELDLPRLGSAFLQLMGMTAEEADQFSQTIDWTTTLVVPIPRFGVDYETVLVDGVEGTLFSQDMERHDPNYMLLWVRDGIIYALTGPGDGQSGIELANSMQ